MSVQIVVCRYHEQPMWIARWSELVPVIVFDKGSIPLERPGKAKVIPMGNTGREAGAWFRFLAGGPWRRAEHTIFLQANPYEHGGAGIIQQALEAAAAGVKYQPLGCQLHCCQDGRPHHPGLPLEKLWKELFPNRTAPEDFHFYAGAQFVLHRDTIKFYTETFYFHASCICDDEPLAPWVIERFWHLLWTEAARPPARMSWMERQVNRLRFRLDALRPLKAIRE